MMYRKNLDVYLCYLVVFFSLGEFNIPGNGVISLVLFGIWCVSVSGHANRLGNELIKDYRIWAFTFFIVCFGILSFLESNKLLAIKYLFNYVKIFSPYLIYQYYSLENNTDKLERIYNGIANILTVWIVIATGYFVLHSGAAAKIASGQWEQPYLALAGGQWLAYGVSVYCVFLTWKILNVEKKLKDFIVLFVSLLFLVLVQSTITILVCIMGVACCVVIYVLKNTVRKIRYVVLVGILGIVLIVGMFFYNDIMERAYVISQGWQLTNSDKILIRIKQVVEILYGRLPASTTSSVIRIGTYITSIKIFLSNIVVGECIDVGVIPGAGHIGNHSELLDALARWGVFLGGGYCYAFFSPFFVQIKNHSKYIIGVVVIALGILNPVVSYQLTTVVLLIIPLYNTLINKRKNV